MSRRRMRSDDAPLLAWGDALRRQKMRRDRFVRRLVLTAAGSAVLLLTAALPPTPRLVWNASPSAPVGLYLVTPGTWIVNRRPKGTPYRRAKGTPLRSEWRLSQ